MQPAEVVKLAADLRNKLTKLGVNFKPDVPLDAVPVHLADIYEVSVAFQNLIDRLLDLPASRSKEATQLMEEIDHHLYDHLPYHLKHLPKGLDDLTRALKRKHTRPTRKKPS